VTTELEKFLEELIASTLSQLPDDHRYCWCALSRAEHVRGVLADTLTDFSQSIGLTFAEYCGIMSGWDLERGAGESCAMYGMESGHTQRVEFGRRLYQKYGRTK